MTQELRCKARNAKGEPCGAPGNTVDPDSRLCATHQPGGVERLREAGKKGGARTANKFRLGGLDPDELPPLKSPQDAAARLDLIAQAIGTGRLGHNEGRAMVSAVQQWLRAFEVGDMAQTVATLQQQLAEAKGTKLERMK